jgi:hypothetical protein
MRCIDAVPSRGPTLRRSPGLPVLCHSSTLLRCWTRPLLFDFIVHLYTTMRGPPILTRCCTLSRRWLGLPAEYYHIMPCRSLAARSSLTICTVCAVCAAWRRPVTVIPSLRGWLRCAAPPRCATVRVSTEFHRRTLTAPMAPFNGFSPTVQEPRCAAYPLRAVLPWRVCGPPLGSLTAQPVPSAMCHVVVPRRRT